MFSVGLSRICVCCVFLRAMNAMSYVWHGVDTMWAAPSGCVNRSKRMCCGVMWTAPNALSGPLPAWLAGWLAACLPACLPACLLAARLSALGVSSKDHPICAAQKGQNKGKERQERQQW